MAWHYTCYRCIYFLLEWNWVLHEDWNLKTLLSQHIQIKLLLSGFFLKKCIQCPGIVTNSYVESHFILHFNVPYLHVKGVETEARKMLSPLTKFTSAVKVVPGVQIQANMLKSLWSWWKCYFLPSHKLARYKLITVYM